VRPAGPRSGDESGFVGGFEGLLFGLLLFVVGTLLVATAWATVDTKFAVDAAARQAVRTYVEAPNAEAAGPEAGDAAVAALAGYGRSRAEAGIKLMAGGFTRCDRVTIQVSEPAPVLILPWIGRVGSGERVTAEHSELVDPFRSGLPGASTCA
jgi:hypothetical protein